MTLWFHARRCIDYFTFSVARFVLRISQMHFFPWYQGDVDKMSDTEEGNYRPCHVFERISGWQSVSEVLVHPPPGYYSASISKHLEHIIHIPLFLELYLAEMLHPHRSIIKPIHLFCFLMTSLTRETIAFFFSRVPFLSF